MLRYQQYYGMPVEVEEIFDMAQQYPRYKAKTPIGEFCYHTLTNADTVNDILSKHHQEWRIKDANKQ